MNILCIIESLQAGGAERTTVRLADYWAAQGHSVVIAVCSHQAVFHPQHPSVRRVVLTPQFSLWKGLRRIRQLAREFQPDAIYGNMPKSCVLAYAAKKAWPAARVAFVEHSTISAQYHGIKKLLVRGLTVSLYRAPDAVLTVSQGALNSLVSWGVPATLGQVVFNPIPLCELLKASQEPTDAWNGASGLRLVAVGRLEHAKAFDVLLDAYAKLRQRGIAFTAVFVGEGSLRAALTQKTQALGLEDAVRFVGYTDNPAAIVAKADMFICSSRHEGFSNVLVEALAVGVDSISTDCASGPAEILGPTSQRLVPTESSTALASKIEEVHLEQLRRGADAKERAVQENLALARPFDVALVASQYLRALGY